MIAFATEKMFGPGQEDGASSRARRSSKLPRKSAGSNKGETQALAFGDENWWLARLLLVRDARRSDETLALGRSCSSGGWNAHHSFSRYLRCLAEKRITTVSIAKRSHRSTSTCHQRKMCSFGSAHPLGYLFNDVRRQFDQAWIPRSCCDGIFFCSETMEMHL